MNTTNHLTEKQMARLLVGMYSYLSHSTLALSLLEDSGPSAETCSNTLALSLQSIYMDNAFYLPLHILH